MTVDLLALRDWLQAYGVTHVAMESTGVYWKPRYYLLEDGFTVLLVNMQHLKHVPGRKSDVNDSEWLAQLLECGLLRGSLVPPAPIRDLRDLTRYRKKQIEDRAQEVNRLHRVLEEAGVKLASVMTDVMGRSGRPCSRRCSGDDRSDGAGRVGARAAAREDSRVAAGAAGAVSAAPCVPDRADSGEDRFSRRGDWDPDRGDRSAGPPFAPVTSA